MQIYLHGDGCIAHRSGSGHPLDKGMSQGNDCRPEFWSLAVMLVSKDHGTCSGMGHGELSYIYILHKKRNIGQVAALGSGASRGKGFNGAHALGA